MERNDLIMKLKNIIAACVSVCIFGSAMSPYASEFNNVAITASALSCHGDFGDGLSWAFEDYDGTLNIYGEGEMYSDGFLMQDWYYYCDTEGLKEKINKIVCLGSPANIESNLFSDMPNLESVTLRNTKRIESNAFSGCTALTSINLQKVDEVASNAFKGCTGLTEVTITNSNCTLGQNAFPMTTVIKCYENSKVQKFAQENGYQFEVLEDTYPPQISASSLSYNDNEMFMYVSVFDNETLIDKVWLEYRLDDNEEWSETELQKYKDTTIASAVGGGSYVGHVGYALSGASSVSTVYYRVKAIDSAGNVSFGVKSDISLKSGEAVYLGNLKNTVIQDDITYLLFDDHAEVYKCPWDKKGKVVIPQTVSELPVTKVCGFSFIYCDKITEVILPDGITEIRRSAFENCTELQSISLPESLTKVKTSVFYSCKSLKEIIIPKNVDELGLSALCRCSSLTDVYIMNSELKFTDSIINNSDKDEYIFTGIIHAYKGSAAQASAEKYNYNFEPIPVTEITITVGEQYTIDADGENLTYQSSNNDVAIVSKSGVVTALSKGQSKVFIINQDNDALVLTVNVVEESIAGDINNDGNLTIADAVLFQKWLLAVTDVKLVNLENADLCKDGKLNVFDLIMIKKELLK